MRAVNLSGLLSISRDFVGVIYDGPTLIPLAANLKRLCCCVSCNVKLFSPRKMIGSTFQPPSDLGPERRNDILSRRTVGDDYRIIALNGFIGDGLGEVDRKQDRVSLTSRWVVRSFEQY